MRERLYRELDWLRGSCNLRVLSDDQLCTVAKWARQQLSRHGRARCPAVAKVEKERRMGRTNRLGWRWVVYIAPVDLQTEESALEWSERGVCLKRKVAFDKKRELVAVEVAHRARQQLQEDAVDGQETS